MNYASWQIDQKIDNNRYQLIKPLGEGGFGITYLARDMTNGNQNCVIKRLKADLPNFAAEQDKFRKEFVRLAGCRHPHIVKIEDIIKEGDVWGVVMEYIAGDALGSLVVGNRALSEAVAIGYIEKIGAALTSIHQQGLLHRDVKPANIMLRAGNQEPVLIDFGLAREFNYEQTLTMTGKVTPAYAPIEQYLGQRQADYTDVYALAATLYHLLTGTAPTLNAHTRQSIADKNAPSMDEVMLWSNLTDAGATDRVIQAVKIGMALQPQDRSKSIAKWLELLTGGGEHLVKFSFVNVTLDRTGKIVNRQQLTAQQRLEDLGNGINLEMVSIPPGSFLMGQSEAEKQQLIKEAGADIYQKYYVRELPQHLVNVPGFYMGKYPVTQAQYLAVMGKNPSKWQGADLPVEQVSWNDAQEFCQRLSKKTERAYRLPSEAEWEYACRAKTTTPFHFGETITTEVANFDGNYTYYDAPKGKYLQKTTPVGSFNVANNFGLSDMHGTVWEWCLDHFHENYQAAPQDGSVWNDKNANDRRIVRGGSWGNNPRNCRSATRNDLTPDYRNYYIGFRVVCEIPRT